MKKNSKKREVSLKNGEKYEKIGKTTLDCILKRYEKKTTESNRTLLIKYVEIFTDLAGGHNSKHCTEKLFYQFLETVLNKFEDEK